MSCTVRRYLRTLVKLTHATVSVSTTAGRAQECHVCLISVARMRALDPDTSSGMVAAGIINCAASDHRVRQSDLVKVIQQFYSYQ